MSFYINISSSSDIEPWGFFPCRKTVGMPFLDADLYRDTHANGGIRTALHTRMHRYARSLCSALLCTHTVWPHTCRFSSAPPSLPHVHGSRHTERQFVCRRAAPLVIPKRPWPDPEPRKKPQGTNSREEVVWSVSHPLVQRPSFFFFNRFSLLIVRTVHLVSKFGTMSSFSSSSSCRDAR